MTKSQVGIDAAVFRVGDILASVTTAFRSRPFTPITPNMLTICASFSLGTIPPQSRMMWISAARAARSPHICIHDEQVGADGRHPALIRRIRDEMKNYGLEKPLIETGGAWFSIAFMRKPQDAALEGTTQKTTHKTTHALLGKTAQRILDAIRHKPGITRNELAEMVGLTPDGIKYHLRSLGRKGILRRIGPDRGGHWIIAQGDSGQVNVI